MDQDDKIALIESKHSVTGFGVLIKLLMKIYGEGYYYKWTEREQLLFSKKINMDSASINEIVNDSIKWDFFHLGMFKNYEILTSPGIQKRYFEAIKRRKEITVIAEYLLIDLPEPSENFTINIINVNNNPINDDINETEGELIPAIIPKVKKRIVKESKVNYSDNVLLSEKEYQTLIGKYGESDTKAIIAKLDSYKLAHGKNYISDYGAICSWVAGEVLKHKAGQQKREIMM